jgi:hypothetical protein
MSTQEIVVIPTLYKNKLPQTLSYPLGAELISRAFVSVPQFENLKIRFWFYSKEDPRVIKTYTVLQLSYVRGEPSLTTGKASLAYGWLDKKWEITVSSVPRDRRHFIKGLLEGEALPIAQRWLIENAGSDEFGGLTLTFKFNEETELLEVKRDSWLSPKQA